FDRPSEKVRGLGFRIELGVAYLKAGDYDKALERLLGAADNERQAPSPTAESTTTARLNLSLLYVQRGEFEQADRLLAQVLAIRKAESEPKAFKAIANTAWLRFLQEKYDESEALAREASADAKDEEQRIIPLHTLARLHIKFNRFAEADELLAR